MEHENSFISYLITERTTVARHKTFIRAILFAIEDGRTGWEIYKDGHLVWQSEKNQPKATNNQEEED